MDTDLVLACMLFQIFCIQSANEYKISGITYRLTQGQYPRDKYLE
jgi:hypothetical protein